MRSIQILRHYMTRVRLLGAVLSFLMLWAIVCGVFACGRVAKIREELNIIASADPENAYLLSSFIYSERDFSQTVADALEREPAVDAVLSVWVANPVAYQDLGISIVLYEPELLEFFPAVKQLGIDFEAVPEGCILGGERFGSLDTGDTVTLSFSGKEVQFPVAGRLKSPYRQLSLSTSASMPLAQDLFIQQEAVLMQATPAVTERLETLAKRMEMDKNLIVVFKPDALPEERQEVLSTTAADYTSAELSTIIANTEKQVEKTLKTELPQPLFLALTAFVSFFSILILVFQRKTKDLAVLYLCGYSKRKCGWLAFAASQVFLLIPVLLSILLILQWPHINWSYADLRWLEPILNTPEYTIIMLLEKYQIDSSCLWVVLLYYLLGTAGAVAITAAAMSKHTPETYLRGERK